MPEMFKSVIPPHMSDKEKNEKIANLGRKITDVVAHKLHGVEISDPEYWGLAEIVTDEMADVALKMDVRHPYTYAEIKKMNKDIEDDHLQKLLDEMSYIGLLEYDYGYHYDHNGRTAPQSERRYILPMFVPGSAELFNMEENKDGINQRLKDHPALASFFERMTFVPLDGITQLVPPGGAGVGMHVIPVEKAITAESKSIDIEHLSYWLKKYEGHIGVGQCSCRVSRAALGEGCADDERNWCIGVGDFADYCKETGKGHPISYEEAMEILRNAEKNGFVHQITNIDGENKIFGICNCNVNICNALRTSQLFNTPNMSRSAYTAHIDIEKCVACGKCVEYCPAGAVKLGRRLRKKDGSETIYPKHVLPDRIKWSKAMYDENYRDNNRINCYESGTAPCKVACPAHIAVEGYIKMVKECRYEDALALIKKDNPFPAICGRICNKRCEAACTRGNIDSAVAIDEIKKFVAELDLNKETRYIPEVVIPSNIIKQYDIKVAIIGGGPAGLSCAYYLATRGYKPTVFEKNPKLGGMLTYGIPSFKLDKKVIEAEIDVLRELGVEFRCGVNVGSDITIEELRNDGYKAFYVAIGCQGGKLPNVAGDDAKNTMVAVDFLRKCTINEIKLDGDVVVIGGGNVGIDCARYAHRLGAKSVKMVVLEKREDMPASKEGIDEVLSENIEIINSYGPKEINKDQDNFVSSIVLKKYLNALDENGKFNPTYDCDDTITLNAKYIIYAIGQSIMWNDLLKGTKVEFWHGNYPVADKLTYQTAEPDIFVGGDVYTGPKFAIDAIEAGKCAAESIHRFVHENASLTIGRNKRDFKALDKDDILVENYDNSKRVTINYDSNIDHSMSLEDARVVLTEAEAKKEALRCLECGMSVVDENKCIGCGICTTKCEFDAIHLVRDHPKASKMIKSEDKFKAILPYAMKRGVKIIFAKKNEAEREAIKKNKEYKKSLKEEKKNARA